MFYFYVLLGDIKIISSLVGNTALFAEQYRAADFFRCLAADGVYTLDALHRCENACTRIGFGTEQQPGNGVGIRAVAAGLDFTDDFAAIDRLPGRAGIMRAYFCPFLIEQVRFRRLEGPLEAGWVSLVQRADI